MVKRGLPYPLCSFVNERSLLSIENLCFIIKELLVQQASIPSGIYNVADDVPLSTNRMIEIMAGGIGKKTKIWFLNKRLLRLLARLGDVGRLPFNSERLQKLTESYVVDNSKILNALQVELPITSEDGLLSTVKHFIGK